MKWSDHILSLFIFILVFICQVYPFQVCIRVSCVLFKKPCETDSSKLDPQKIAHRFEREKYEMFFSSLNTTYFFCKSICGPSFGRSVVKCRNFYFNTENEMVISGAEGSAHIRARGHSIRAQLVRPPVQRRQHCDGCCRIR